MSTLEEEIKKTRLRLKELKQKQRKADAQESARFGKVLVAIINEIGEDSDLTVRELCEKARGRIKEEKEKRSAVSKKTAAKHKAETQNVQDTEQSDVTDAPLPEHEGYNIEPNNETNNQPYWE